MNGICLRIHQVRDDWKISQVEFAKRVGVTNAHISAIEKGKTTPSPALVKLVSKEFKVNEGWLISGEGPQDAEELDDVCENLIINAGDKLNTIRTRDNMPIRSRVIQLEDLFVRIIDLSFCDDQLQQNYFDICYKLFYHLAAYLEFQKKSLSDGQFHCFPFPDDLLENLKKDISLFEKFFDDNMNKNK